MAIQAFFFKFRPTTSAEPIRGIEDKDLIDEILQHPDLKDFKSNHSGTIFLEVPMDIEELDVSQKLKKLLTPYKGQVLGFEI